MTDFFTLEVTPFVAAIILELVSPVTSRRAENLVASGLGKKGAKTDQIGDILEYFRFAANSLQVISSVVLSLTAVLVLPSFRTKPTVGVSFAVALVFILVLSIVYYDVSDPYKDSHRHLGPYGWVGLLSMALNVLIIAVLVVDGGLPS